MTFARLARFNALGLKNSVSGVAATQTRQSIRNRCIAQKCMRISKIPDTTQDL